MREYVTVLHAHKSEPSLTLGPRYSCPDRRGLVINAARDETATLMHAKRTLTTPMACGLQVCRDFTRILIEGVIYLDSAVSGRRHVDKEALQYLTQVCTAEKVPLHCVALIWATAEPKRRKKVVSPASTDI